jgi:hypothetical protein
MADATTTTKSTEIESQNAPVIAEIGLTEIDGEPRARDLDIAERLGFERPRVIRELVIRNKSEIEAFGPLAVRHGKSRGQEFAEYWLTEEQALLVSVLSKAPNAPAVRAMLIKVFVVWRRGNLVSDGVAPFTGAWIETTSRRSRHGCGTRATH